MAGLVYKYIKVNNNQTGQTFQVSFLDQNTMYSTGQAGQVNDGTIKIGTYYKIASAACFLASGGNILRCVTGTGGGLTFSFREETVPSSDVGGYYINGTRVCPWVEGLGGNFCVVLIRNRDALANMYTAYTLHESCNAIFWENGSCWDGSSKAFEDNQPSWGRMTKARISNNGNFTLYANNAPGGSTVYYPFRFGAQWSSFGPYTVSGASEVDIDNPYYDGGISTSGGGDPDKQNWAEDSDIVTVDELPDETYFGATAVGLVTIFSPTKEQLKRLADVIWGEGFFNFVQHMVQNIEDLFISLSLVPFVVPKSNTVEVTWFSYDLGGEVPIGTGIYLTLAARQWVEFNMGSISLTGGENSSGFASDSVLDYSPYSKLGIYLPFIGYQELDIDECRGNVLTLIYRIDILSGSCLAIVRVNGRDIYQFSGTCSVQIPLTSEDASAMFTNAVSIATAAASAGSTAAIASAGNAFTQSRVSEGKLTQAGAEVQNAQHAAMVSNAEGSLVSATVQGVMGMKPNYKKSGAISGSTSLFGVKQPYLFLTTPRQSIPEHYQRYCGFPSNITGKLGDFSGYTVVEDIRLNGLVATSSEVEEIYALLKSGVII